MFSRSAWPRSRALLSAGSVTALLALSPGAFAAEGPTGEVVARDTYSTTTKAGSEFRTRSFPEPVNFKADDGVWQPIDRSLVREADGTVHPAAVDGDATIPASIAHPVVIEHDGRELSFDLRGASGSRELAGTKAKFDDAIDGVDIAYKARGNGLKETLTLTDPSSPRRFVYDVTGDEDLEATRGLDGQLVFKDSQGKERFRVAAPLAWDSAEPKAYASALELSVSKVSPGHWELTLAADDEWLDDPQRVYPVTLDPDYYWVDSALRFHGANLDAYVAGGGHAGTPFAASNILQVGYTNNRPYKSLFKFDVSSAIPKYATATKATFLLWQPQSTPKNPANMRLRTVTKEWDNSVTWDVAKTGQAWTTGGGDVSADPNLTGAPTTVGAQNYWYYWDAPLAAVNGWIRGSLPNYGLQLSTDPGAPPTTAYVFTSTEGDQALWPALDVTWKPDAVPPTGLTATGSGSPESVWLNGTQTATLTASALDDEAGIATLRLKRDGGTILATASVTCDDGLCPDAARADLSFAATTLSEGAHTLTLEAVDAAGNVAATAPWTIFVDRTAPPAPGTASLSYFGSVAQEATISWDEATDPALADGSPGSGAASHEVRFGKNGAPLGPWTSVGSQGDLDLTGVNVGDVVALEVRTSDAAGNTSPVKASSVTVQAIADDPSLTLFADGAESTNSSSTARRPPVPGFPPLNYNGCGMRVSTGQDDSERDGTTYESTRFRATGDLVCAGNNPVGYEYVIFTVCLKVKVGGQWQNYNFRGYKGCDSVAWRNPESKIDQFEINKLCYPGSHEIMVWGRVKVKSRVTNKIRSQIATKTFDGEAVCNNSGAWRYLASAASSPGTELGNDLIRGGERPPGDPKRSGRKGFDAHHIVLATKTTEPARLLQAIGYSCDDIWPNESRNGVWLRGWTLSGPNDPRGRDDRYNDLPTGGKLRAYHPTIHTSTYLEYVREKLRPAVANNYNCDEAAVKPLLTGVKNQLKNNDVPYAPLEGETGPDPIQD